jgi:hypothetical protein
MSCEVEVFNINALAIHHSLAREAWATALDFPYFVGLMIIKFQIYIDLMEMDGEI